MTNWMYNVPWRSVIRWWVAGTIFTAVGLGLLYVFTDVLHVALMLGTLLSAELTLLVRFLVNDRWVFSHPRPSWKRLWQFHVASAAGTAIWWSVSNVLPTYGINYLIAAIAGTACAVLCGISTNFLWIWRKRTE